MSLVQKNKKPKFKNFNDEILEEILNRQWNLHKNKYVDNDEQLVFYKLNGDELEHREELREFISCYRNDENEQNKKKSSRLHAQIVVAVDHPSVFFNFSGWEEDIVFCFNLNNLVSSMKQLVKRLRLYPFDINAPKEKLKIKSKGVVDLESVENICYCLADGNYTEIHLSNGKVRVESKAIAFIEKRLLKIASIDRINRGYILNRNRVYRINSKDGKVYFTSSDGAAERVLSFSETMIKRIKEFVYWY